MQLELFFFTLHVFQFFYLRINKLNVHNNTISISSFQTGLKDLFRSTSFYFKSKVIEGSNKRKNIYFFIFGYFFSKCTFGKLCCFFRLVDIQSTQFVQWQYAFITFTFSMKHFSRMTMVTKLFRLVTCCEELSPINTHDISTEWFCRITWHIKYISQPAEDVLTPH